MSRGAPSRVVAAVALGAFASVLCPARSACAADARAESAAAIATKKAASEYLAANFSGAAAVLEKAVRACGADKCAPSIRAALVRDLGTMQFRDGETEAAAKSFARAVALQPDIQLNPDYDAPDVRAAWQGATGGGGVDQPSGDFDHTPAAEQKKNTPLPIFVKYDQSVLLHVSVRYKGANTPDWERVDLKRMSGGWGGLIPCAAVTAGTVRYYLQGFDANQDLVATSGNRSHPYTVPITSDIAGEAPHLPGKEPPQSCDDSGCDPDAPGCQSHPPEGDESTAEPAPSPPRPGTSPAGQGAYASWWFGIAGAVDFASLPAGTDVCQLLSNTQPANASGYYCTNPNGSDFPSRASSAQNSALVAGQSGNVAGGVHPGDLRVMLAVDYAPSPSILVGVRVGDVSNTYPGSAAIADGKAFSSRVHLEVRGTYLFGPDPLASRGFSPMIFLGTGAAVFDGHTTTVVAQQNVAGQLPVVAWKTSGPWFVAGGGGLRYQFSLRAAFTAAVRANAAFGGGGLLTFGPELAFQYGF